MLEHSLEKGINEAKVGQKSTKNVISLPLKVEKKLLKISKTTKMPNFLIALFFAFNRCFKLAEIVYHQICDKF